MYSLYGKSSTRDYIRLDPLVVYIMGSVSSETEIVVIWWYSEEYLSATALYNLN